MVILTRWRLWCICSATSIRRVIRFQRRII